MEIKMIATQNRTTTSLNAWLAFSLFAALAIIFVLYIHSVKQVDHAHDMRHKSFLVAAELRQTSDDLTRMARTYIATGNPVYKQYYLNIIAISNGQLPRPKDYTHSYWELAVVGKQPTATEAPISLLELFRANGFTEKELDILKISKINSDHLTNTELAAMALVEQGGAELNVNRQKALSMVFGDDYNHAKVSILEPINQFYKLQDTRTLAAVHKAERKASIILTMLIGFGFSLMFMLWRINQAVRITLGGTANEVYQRIKLLGTGDFATEIPHNQAQENSVLAWLAETQRNLQRLQQERVHMESAQRVSEERYRTLFNHAQIGINLFSADADSFLIDCNPWMCSMLGYTAEEMRQLRPGDVVAEAEQSNVEPALVQIASKPNYFREWQLKRKDGSVFPAEVIGTTLPDGTLLSMARDITARKRAEEQLRSSDERFRRTFKLIPNPLTLQSKDGVMLDCSDAFCDATGFSREEIIGRNTQELGVWINPDERKIMREQLLLNGQVDNLEFQLRRRDGEIRIMQISARYLTAEPEPILLAVAHDITARKRAEAEVRESVLHTQAILDNMFDGVITINIKGVIESFNTAASHIFGYSTEDVLGKNITILMPAHYRSQHENHLSHHGGSLDEQVLNILREVEGQRKNGEIFPMSLSITKILRAGKITFVGVVRDISQQRRDEEEIYRLAFYDPLTNLPNRRLLYDRLQQAIHTSCRTDQHGALMFLDLDHFKQLNDSLGHDVGDILLQQVASRLQACVREGDSVARMGGDEFVMLIEALSIYPNEAASQAEAIAHKILASLSQPYRLREHTYVITPSIGIVVFLHQEETFDELLKKADVAMYQAKTAGRNNARFFDPTMQAAVSVRVALEKSMRLALEQQEFLLHYQFQVDSQGTPTGVEALVRWHHSEHGMVSPASFIPLAEETGMILTLGQWVLETACAQLVEWAENPMTAKWTMAVNVSVSQFAQPNFVANVAKALEKTGANPHLLKLELTESMLAKDVEDVIVKMFEIKALGVTFSLDDFGTGYSSLSYLKRLPLDQLKIDQSFVRDLLTDANDATIARTIIALGHSLSLSVIAEGVETLEQRNALAEMGCDAYQGYYFARPVVAEDLSQTLRQIPR